MRACQEHNTRLQRKVRDLHLSVKSYEEAEKKRRKRGKGTPPSPALAQYTDVLTRAAQRHSILYDLWPNKAAFNVSENPGVDPFTEERYRNAAATKMAHASEIYLAIGDMTTPPARGLERYMGKIAWIRTFVRTFSYSRSPEHLHVTEIVVIDIERSKE